MNAEFKVFYNNVAATVEMLGEIETITVEQQIDRVWEARIKIPMCMTDEGVWKSEDVPTYGKFSRVRVEARVGEGDFAPLIDGRIVGNDTERSSIPGKSVLTLIVHDDSSLLHGQDEVCRYEAAADSDIAREIFEAAKLGGTPAIEPTEARPDNPAAQIIQRGTKMQILRSLAARHQDFYAYVLPGEKPGESVGCFKRLPVLLDEKLPPLVMFGEDANLAEFNVKENARSPSEVVAATMNLRDKSIASSSSSYRDATLLGDEVSTDADAANVTKKRLPAGQTDTVDLDAATKGAAAKSGFSLEADGSVLPLCYAGVLSPYRVVAVRLSDSRFSANYVVFKVVHTLTASSYTQTFSVKANAVSPPASASASVPAASASASAGFNVQLSIF